MPSEKQQNLQDSFLNHVRKQKVPVTIFLVNGVKLQGVITWFDNFCLLLRRDAQSQLVYKHAISTIMPGAPIQLFDPEQVLGDEPAKAGHTSRQALHVLEAMRRLHFFYGLDLVRVCFDAAYCRRCRCPQ